jgi:type I restriction enzyme, R subunit
LLDREGYAKGNPEDFDPNLAIDTAKLQELQKLSDQPNWQRMIFERIDRKIKKDGVSTVLKKGIAIDDANLTLYYSHP